MVETKLCRLILSTGHTFIGTSIGSTNASSGELVFSTGMVGYPETLTDPSFFGQILVFSYPLIGNYGVSDIPNAFDPILFSGFESERIQVAGIVMAVYNDDSFHWESKTKLHDWMKKTGIPGISGIDTRELIHIIRSNVKVSGRIESLVKPSPTYDFFDPQALNVLRLVSTGETRIFGKGKTRIALLDFGAKWSLIRSLISRDCEVALIPWSEDFQNVDASGFLLSNGPGDPVQTDDLVERCKKLLERPQPILGVCLGHQIVALASGAKTERLPYGHRGHNQPVVHLESGRGFMTSQNHGYSVIEKSIGPEWEISFKNLNDQSVEGFKHKSKEIRCVQFHPEAHSGPQETAWILDDFVRKAAVYGT